MQTLRQPEKATGTGNGSPITQQRAIKQQLGLVQVKYPNNRFAGHKSHTNPFTLLKELLEQHAAKQSPGRIEELAKIFVHTTRMGLLDIVSITQG